MPTERLALACGLLLSPFFVVTTYAQSNVAACCCGQVHSGSCGSSGLAGANSANLPSGHYVGDGHLHFFLPQFADSAPTDDVASYEVAAFQIANRWSNTATNGFVGSVQGNPLTLTWGIVQEGTSINDFGGTSGTSNLVAFLDAEVGNSADAAITDLQQKSWFPIFQDPYERWEDLSGLTFNYEPNDDGAALSSSAGVLGVRADLRFSGTAITNNNALARNAFPNNGDGLLDTGNPGFFGNSSNNFRGLRNVIAHEVGHGIGFRHVESSNSGFLLEPTINTSFDGPQLDDILAVHRNYGDVLEKNGGNDTIATATPLGAVSAGTRLARGLDAINTFVAPDDVDFYSIDDNSDIDIYEFTLTSRQTVSLSVTPQGPTYNEGPEDGTQSPFETRRMADLTFSLLDSSQNSLGFASAVGLGGTESIDNVILDPGTYYAEIGTTDNAAQFYRLDLKTEADDRLFIVDEDFTAPGEVVGPPPPLLVDSDLPVAVDFTFTADQNGTIGVAPQGFLAEADALASSRVGDNGAGNVTNTVQFTVDTTGLQDIELELVAYQHPGTYEGTENLLIEVNTGSGFVTLLQDFEVWNGENDLVGEGSSGRDGNDTPTSTGPLSILGADDGILDVRISLTTGFFDNNGSTPDASGEVYYLDSLYVTGSPIIDIPLVGDFNDDGFVDSSDYAFWRNSLGQTGVDLPADADGDGTVDADDLQFWLDNFGASSAQPTTGPFAVPEPATSGLAIALGLALLSKNRRRERR